MRSSTRGRDGRFFLSLGSLVLDLFTVRGVRAPCYDADDDVGKKKLKKQWEATFAFAGVKILLLHFVACCALGLCVCAHRGGDRVFYQQTPRWTDLLLLVTKSRCRAHSIRKANRWWVTCFGLHWCYAASRSTGTYKKRLILGNWREPLEASQ
ncbi:hypothetical protein QBC42DRAFT_101266 [Cladorrhinum samala]|uniref:Uncharacterized protein n=1 Tax=Cladorrhinum samala TaxID=585594 RepID=A0AAV9HPE5_9PEZI|nr:hypothetical protein QBC42DRAFT_101266 [Cladorrhinum samala]